MVLVYVFKIGSQVVYRSLKPLIWSTRQVKAVPEYIAVQPLKAILESDKATLLYTEPNKYVCTQIPGFNANAKHLKSAICQVIRQEKTQQPACIAQTTTYCKAVSNSD